MAPTQVCRFFASGHCRNGSTCTFIHERKNAETQDHAAPALPAIQRLSINSPAPPLGQRDDNSFSVRFDSRAKVPCRYFTRPGGCKNPNCPFLHIEESGESNVKGSDDSEQPQDEDQEHDDDSTRDILGAVVQFNEFGQVLKISFPTDYSLACITGLRSGTTPEDVVKILHDLGFDVNVGCVRIPTHTLSSEAKATVKVEDPLFAQKLSTKLKNQASPLVATPVAIDNRQTHCRKVYISWHKATRSTWLNFGNGDIAARVADKFNEGTYKCLDQRVKATMPVKSGGGRFYTSYNRQAWTITLNNVPTKATKEDIQECILSLHDKPRHVELGSANRTETDAAVSVDVRLRLDEFGPLDDFFLAPVDSGKRAKAKARFQDEADARSACSLNNIPLDILGKGKLTVTLIQSVKVKILRAIYMVSKQRIDEQRKIWEERHLTFHPYHDVLQRFVTLKIEGDSATEVASARKKLDEILGGTTLMDGEIPVWSSALNSNGTAYKKLKEVEKELDVVIVRDKSKRQIQFHGPPEKVDEAVSRITNMLKEESCSTYEIYLDPDQFSWAIINGFNSILQALGPDIAIFDIVSKKITITGTHEQYTTALSIATKTRSIATNPSTPDQTCPICFCEPENPIQTSCNHTYCLECFEATCHSGASTTNSSTFSIRCQGTSGTCLTPFPLDELKPHLTSSSYETILHSSFKDYIHRHPQKFTYCPTPDCGFIYRPSTTSSPIPYTCPNCFEAICTYCHARHGEYTCAEYKDITSGGYEAMEKLKRELNIKDCPKCKTAMEKTEGCNHMTCAGCGAHICWVCMEVFGESGACYEHMREKHGGIGLGLEGFM